MLKVNDSERLSFALMGAGDADLLYELDQDVEVMRHINGGKITTMQDVHEVFLPRMAAYRNVEKGWGLWKVSTTSDGAFIGWVLVRPMGFFSAQPEWDNLELGWRFKRTAWGVGYATEAAQHIMSAIVAQQKVTTFSAIATPDNQGSINIMKKLGMTYQKTALNKDPLGDMQVVYYALSV